jgi:hypothetical protein
MTPLRSGPPEATALVTKATNVILSETFRYIISKLVNYDAINNRNHRFVIHCVFL